MGRGEARRRAVRPRQRSARTHQPRDRPRACRHGRPDEATTEGRLAEGSASTRALSAEPGTRRSRERIDARIETSDAPAADKQAARERLAALPDGTALCHGDFHPDNVLLSPRGPVVIDWSSASRGHPVGDLAWTSRLLRTADLPPW